ncbi:MAG TPA: 3-hydroxybutyrate oligomer hydrolase family protein [Ramlibacter sp.]|nr:3-hydroxybutyrate oligomer hydrolase family protein [Ramlibacter sp.]HZY19462.1 3-hydroxybutyrate oligomer hydrolase family protein [Ramlibacter sp.]
MPHRKAARPRHLLLLAPLALAACGGGNELPPGITEHGVTVYAATAPGAGTTAQTQDLLTGGLGYSGLLAPVPPAYADPVRPTALELRRNALHSAYRLLDTTPNGGFGRLYGPNVTVDEVPTASEGLIPGREYLASLDDGTGEKRVAIAVQIPDSFDPANPCVVVGPSSGSRGVYGAISTAGEWGLKHGCAVALTDTGKGVGLYDPADDTVNTIAGTRATRAEAGTLNHFAARITDAVRAAFDVAFPNRIALKHAHSQQNPEKDWGADTLVATQYALYALNDRYGTPQKPAPFHPRNTLVIAGSVSNGGAAVLRAAELDQHKLIDGVVAGEPLVQMPTAAGYGIVFGGQPVAGHGKPVLDFVTYGNLYQPCAALAAGAAMTELTFFNFMPIAGMTARAQARCDGLAAKGLVAGATTAERSADALARLRAYGWSAEHDQMHNAHYGFGNGPILSAMYTMAYGRASLLDNLCGSSFAAVDAAGAPAPMAAAVKAQAFATMNGTANGSPPAAGVSTAPAVVYNDSLGGARAWQLAVSPSTGVADFGLDNALCQRALVTGKDPVTQAPLSASSTPTRAQSDAVRAGMAEVTMTSDLNRTPTLVVAGRSDALLPSNNSARAYVARNRVVEGPSRKLRYIEVTNAQHFDSFNSLSGFDTRFVPLHVYYNRAMDAMWAHLRSEAPLPPSQVVRALPRGGVPGAAPAVTSLHLPAIAADPAPADAISFSGNAVAIPN